MGALAPYVVIRNITVVFLEVVVDAGWVVAYGGAARADSAVVV